MTLSCSYRLEPTLLLTVCLLLLNGGGIDASAGFIKSPMSQVRLSGDSVELHCEAVGQPIPEIQWWFEANEPNDTFDQLWDGARQDRIQINATYNMHATSAIYVASLRVEDSGTYECRVSNDPDRNHLWKTPKVKWIRSQANVIVIEYPEVFTGPSHFVSGTHAMLFCNITAPPSNITGHTWKKGEKILQEDGGSDLITTYKLAQVNADTSGSYDCYFMTDPPLKGTIEVSVSPHVVAYKPSEHGNEGDVGVMTCKSKSYPPVENWNWYKESDGTNEPILNGTGDHFLINSNGTKTELRIASLNMETDQGTYICNGTNSFGSGGATVSLRVRSRFAALWPFLGIVAEVLVLVTIIFIYEKRRKPDEIPDEDDGGAAPLKSNAGTDHKEENVRQRNSTEH
ncbi:basigin [Ambystoma mexicanum]|uniref:basigin n=1 Tax=Ambystoma mexicanum TaxID=8296 RepID=UPI0037E787A0